MALTKSCPQCGWNAPARASFCARCGSPLGPVVAEPTIAAYPQPVFPQSTQSNRGSGPSVLYGVGRGISTFTRTLVRGVVVLVLLLVASCFFLQHATHEPTARIAPVYRSPGAEIQTTPLYRAPSQTPQYYQGPRTYEDVTQRRQNDRYYYPHERQ